MKGNALLEKHIETDKETAQKAIQHLYTWMVTMDMVENLANDYPELKKMGYNPKGKLRNKNDTFVKAAKDFNTQLKKCLGEDERAEQFGEMADFLQELFEIGIFVKPENRIDLPSEDHSIP